MTSPLPAYLPGQYYHFYNRGRSRLHIFIEPENYLFVIKKIKVYAEKFDLSVIAYCLMPNHYHFLVRQDGDFPAGFLPQRVFNSYSKAFNKRYNHCGTLFEGPYKGKLIDQDSYLLNLCRYIHGNPQKDGLVDQVDEWPFSNYLEWIGVRNGTLFDPLFVQENFQTPGAYAEFVQDGIKSALESRNGV